MKLHILMAAMATIAVGQMTSVSTTFATTSDINTSIFTTLPTTSTTLSTMTSVPSIPGLSITTGAVNGTATSTGLQVTTSAVIAPNATAPATVPNEYRLRVQTQLGAPKRFYGQYLAAWSISYNNLTADTFLTHNTSEAAKFYLNGTLEQVDLGTTSQEWWLEMTIDVINARWYPVGMHSPHNNWFGTFWVNDTGLQWTPNVTPPPHTGNQAIADTYFAGWMVCDWWHGVPQLFYRLGGYNDTKLPSDCGMVNLVPEPVKR